MKGNDFKKYFSMLLTFLLIIAVMLPAQIITAQNGSNFDEIIQKISSSENLSNQEKEEIMDEAIELHYEKGVSLEQISEVLDQNGDFNEINIQFDGLDDLFDDDDDRDDDDRDDDDRDDDDEDDDDRDDDDEDDD